MNKDNVLDLIKKVTILCEKQKALGYPGEATQMQVEEYILPEMKELEQKILQDDIPENRYVNSFGNAFKCWNWDMRAASELYLALLELHQAYES